MLFLHALCSSLFLHIPQQYAREMQINFGVCDLYAKTQNSIFKNENLFFKPNPNYVCYFPPSA